MSKITLDLKCIEDDFFEGQQLLALSAPTIPDYRFCWLLNHYLNMSFERQPEMDVQVNRHTGSKIPKPDLFSPSTPHEASGLFYFSVYKHQIEGSDFAVFLYSNFSEGQKLIREIKNADFFILFPENPILGMVDKFKHCTDLKSVLWMKVMDIKGLKSKDAFIL